MGFTSGDFAGQSLGGIKRAALAVKSCRTCRDLCTVALSCIGQQACRRKRHRFAGKYSVRTFAYCAAFIDGDQSCRATNADASPHVHFCTFSQLGTSSGENAHTTSLLLFGLTQRVNNFSSTKITWRQSCCAYLRANRTRRRLWLTLILGLWDFGILGARQRPPSREVAGVEHTG